MNEENYGSDKYVAENERQAIPESFYLKKRENCRNGSRGMVYGVGVGPGDPELMTVRAIRIIREADVIAVPGRDPEDSLAYRIALKAVPEIKDKTVIGVDMPMKNNPSALENVHRDGARRIEEYLEDGQTAAYLTLGDPTVYSTFIYLVPFLEEDGFETGYVSGITSFCAAAAKLNVPLCMEEEKLHVVPALYDNDTDFKAPGTYVFMKSGRSIKDLRVRLKDCEKDIMAVENCGLPGEKVYRGLNDIPDDAGYFMIVLAKNKR